MKMRRNEIISQSQNCFDQSGYTGRCFKMPDIGFNRTEEERPIRATVLAQCRDHRVYFNRVTQRCTGAMSFDVGNIRSIHSSICQSRANDCCLRRATGDCQATAAPILIDGGTASDRRLSTMTPQPSPRAKPSADSSKALQNPSGASMRDLHNATVFSGISIKLTPPASAMRDSPLRRLRHAKCTATSDEEQEVSTTKLGPLKPSRSEERR